MARADRERSSAVAAAAPRAEASDPLAMRRFVSELEGRLVEEGVVVLAPLDAADTLALTAQLTGAATCVMLDPWYNKGVGGERSDYVPYICGLLHEAARAAPHVYLWGFPEIVARFVERLPQPLELTAWLTWYYKNNPSVIRGWRSAQMACLHLTGPGAVLHPEAFLNEAQLAKKAEGKLRYLPGPPSVIEAALLVGFVGRTEQTGHPAQKPEAVFDPLLRMATVEGDLVVDPMCGSGTTGAVARARGRRALLADQNDDYVGLVEERLGVERLAVPPAVTAALREQKLSG